MNDLETRLEAHHWTEPESEAERQAAEVEAINVDWLGILRDVAEYPAGLLAERRDWLLKQYGKLTPTQQQNVIEELAELARLDPDQ